MTIHYLKRWWPILLKHICVTRSQLINRVFNPIWQCIRNLPGEIDQSECCWFPILCHHQEIPIKVCHDIDYEWQIGQCISLDSIWTICSSSMLRYVSKYQSSSTCWRQYLTYKGVRMGVLLNIKITKMEDRETLMISRRPTPILHDYLNYSIKTAPANADATLPRESLSQRGSAKHAAQQPSTGAHGC